jgi:hypothetical protein
MLQKYTKTLLSLLEWVQSQNNSLDGIAFHPIKSVAANPQQVSLPSAHQGQLDKGP